MAIYLTPSGRVYCSETGRFLQKDHLAPRGTNSYAYPNNSPVNAVDPSGLRAVTLHFYLGGVPKYAAKFTPDMQERLRAILARCFRTCKCDTVTVVFEGPATPATRLGSNQNDIGIAINFSGEEGPLTAGGGQALAQSAHWGTSIFTNAWTKARDYQNEEPPGKTGILLPNLLAHRLLMAVTGLTHYEEGPPNNVMVRTMNATLASQVGDFSEAGCDLLKAQLGVK